MYVALAHLYLEKREWTNVLSSIFRAVGAWPLNYGAYRFLALFVYKYATGKTKKN